MSKFLRLSSETGTKILTYTVIGIGVGSFVSTIMAHSFAIDQYSGLFQLYNKGSPVPVPEDIELMLAKVGEDMKVPVKNPVTKLFSCIGFDVMNFGTTMSFNGVRIGLPVSFFYRSADDIERETIMVGYKPVPWDSMDGQNLEKSLVLSDIAKKFALAYELALADTGKMYFHSFSGPLAVVVCAKINNYFCDSFGLQYRALHIKMVFYTMLLVFGLGVYFLVKDAVTHYFELEANKRVGKCNEKYLEGGIEFYEKQLIRNKALRNLLPNGKSEYTSTGDSTFLFRQKHVSITQKKNELERQLQALGEYKEIL